MRAFDLKKKLLSTVLIDLLLLAAGLLTFAYFHHVRVRDTEKVAIPAAQAAAASGAQVAPETVADNASPDEAAQEEAPGTANAETPVSDGMFGARFADKFAAGEPQVTDTSYVSENVAVSWEKKTYNDTTYFLTDIYVRDVSCFRTAVALDYKEFNDGARKNCIQVPQLANITDAIVAISGDNYVFRNAGVLAVRNGFELANKTGITDDICIMYYDGTVETFYTKSSAAWREKIDAVYAKGPYQIWCFGPSLLDEAGGVPTKFNSSVAEANPRSAFGYYEPGHYCFLLADGRQKGYSIGFTLTEMSEIFAALGCKAAYNLDGGDTVAMAFRGALVNKPEEAQPRDVSDILYIGEPVAKANLQEG